MFIVPVSWGQRKCEGCQELLNIAFKPCPGEHPAPLPAHLHAYVDTHLPAFPGEGYTLLLCPHFEWCVLLILLFLAGAHTVPVDFSG